MVESLVGLFIGYAICKVLAGGEDFFKGLFHVAHDPKTGPAPTPSPTLTSTAVSFPTAKPEGLPPWPSGWKAATTTPGMVQRAWDLLPMMKDGQVKYEQGPAGGWLAYYRHKFGGKTGVTVHEPKAPMSAPQPPIVAPVTPSSPIPSVPVSTPAAAPAAAAPAGRTLRTGSKGEDVAAWQRAIGVTPADGKFGKGTKAATQAWQRSHGLPADGVVGPDTWRTVATS